jgi:hypothetical protein
MESYHVTNSNSKLETSNLGTPFTLFTATDSKGHITQLPDVVRVYPWSALVPPDEAMFASNSSK